MQEGLKLWPGGVSGGLAYQGLPGPTTAYQDLPSGFWRWEFPGRRRKEMIRSSIKMRITIKIIGKERPPPSGGWRRQPVRSCINIGLFRDLTRQQPVRRRQHP